MKKIFKKLYSSYQNSPKVSGLSLIEILVVLVIVGILALLALPNLMPLISKAKSTEAKLQLEHLHTLEKTYFFSYSKYTTDLVELGFEQEKLATNGGKANYLIEVVDAGNNTFKAKATAVTDFDGDGVLSVWEVDQEKNIREVTKD